MRFSNQNQVASKKLPLCDQNESVEKKVTQQLNSLKKLFFLTKLLNTVRKINNVMTKYLFYAAFFYFCWYAGNKAFPPTAQQVYSSDTTEQTSIRNNERFFAATKYINAESHVQVNSWPEKNEMQKRGWLSNKQQLLHINMNTLSKYNLIIPPVGSHVQQLNLNHLSLISKDEMQPLTILNTMDK